MTTNIYELAELAEASYANLVNGDATLVAELQNHQNDMYFSFSQAEDLANSWAVVAHRPDTDSGFSSTLFRNIDGS